MSRVYDFLKENNMLPGSYSEIEDSFTADMQNKKTLCMSRTFLKSEGSELPEDRVLAIDAGGTNIRFAVFENGIKIREKRHAMYGMEQPISADDFFKAMAAEISEFDCERVGFCFSYPMEILPNCDGKVLWLSKEIKIDGIEGKVIGKEINKHLEKKRRFYLLNDTVACQLGSDADFGLILGTGFNICFTDTALNMIVNAECGQYGLLPEGRFDAMLNEAMHSFKPCAEKQISGAYLGKLIEITSEAYFCRKLPVFDLKDVSEFLSGEGILHNFFSEDERRDFAEIIELLLDRSVKTIASFVKCMLMGRRKAVIGIEGSTVYKLPGYYDKLTKAVSSIEGCEFEFRDARGAVILGAAKACRTQ